MQTEIGSNLEGLDQQALNEKTFEKVEELIKEESQGPIITPLFQTTFTKKTIPKYIPLDKFSDKASETVPTLKHGLKRTLYSPGVHYQTDPRTNYNNFDAHLSHIPQIDEFKMDKIGSFTPSGRDNRLLKISHELNKSPKTEINYMSSTSSMTGLLMKLHSALSNGRPINTSKFSSSFPPVSKFSMFSKVPTSVVVTPKGKNIYSIDADRSTDTEITLSILGNALELMLTKTPEEFRNYLKSSDKEPLDDPSAYHYAKIGKFLIRSQLDAYHGGLPGKGTFDIKTRAVCAIRMDIAHTNHFPTSYQINKIYGLFESFEREIYDAARIVMFKYSLQARLGNMDGIFMAFHNMRKLLGYQYLPLSEIDDYFFGELKSPRYQDRLFHKLSESDELQNEKASEHNQLLLDEIVKDYGNGYQTKREALSSKVADHELKLSFGILSKIMNTITRDTKGNSFRMMVKKQKFIQPSAEGTEEKQSADDHEGPVELTIVVNTLSNAQVDKMQMLVNERYEDALSELEDYTTMEKIKFLVKNRPNERSDFHKLNKWILRSSAKRGFYVYQVKLSHSFNGKKSQEEYPFPDIDFLDNHEYDWDVDVEMNKIVSPIEKEKIYESFCKQISSAAFRHGDSDMDVYGDDGSIMLDPEASELQNVMRAHSVKAENMKNYKK